MRDLLLFARLWEGADDPASVVASLHELAQRPIARRVPWFAALAPALAHREPRLRAAALHALRGADGRMALAAFVAGLDDDDGGVREAAVSALRELIPRDPLRWAHVVFHPRADVRRAALAIGEGEAPSELCFYLLADPACRDLLAPMLGDAENDPRIAVPSTGYAAVLAFLERERITSAEAFRLLARIPPAGIIGQARHGHVRSAGHVATLLDRHDPSDAAMTEAVASADGFDGLFALMAEVDDPRVTKLRRGLGAAFVSLSSPERRRVAAAIRVAMLRHGDDDELALLWAATDPSCLLLSALPIALRRRAAAGLATVTHRLPKLGAEVIEELFTALVITDAVPDLAAAGGLVCLARGYEPLLAAVPLEVLLPAMARDPKSAAAVLMIPDGSRHGRKWLLEKLGAHDAETFAKVLAWLAIFAPADKLSFVEELDAWQAMALATCLIDIERGVALKYNKLSQLVSLIGFRLTDRAEPASTQRGLGDVARQLLGHAEPLEHRFGCALFEHLAEAVGGEGFALEMSLLPDPLLLALVALIPMLTRVGYGCELALASTLIDHDSEAIRAWATSRAPTTVRPPPIAPPQGVCHLSDAELDRVATCADAALPAVMTPWLRHPTVRLAEALARRPVATPIERVCAALLGCHDDPDLVAEQLERFASHDPAFIARVEHLAVAWETCRELPWLGSAWLWRWERHAIAVTRRMGVAPARPVRFLTRALELPSEILRARVFRAVGETLSMWSVRAVPRVHVLVGGGSAAATVDLVVEQLDTDVGVGAAKIFVGLHRAGVAAAIDAVPRVKALLPDLGEPVRRELTRVVHAKGLVARGAAHRRRAPTTRREDRDAIRTSCDPEELERWCSSPSDEIVQEAALRAVEIGGDALTRLSRLILAAEPVPCLRTLIESVALWPEHPALDALRGAIDAGGDAELRFRLCLAFIERAEPWAEKALAIACEEARAPWFRPTDYDRLAACVGPFEVALALAPSPQPHAYMRAVGHLVKGPDDPRVRAALRAFLLSDSQRLDELRYEAALYLHTRGDAIGFPLLLGHALDPEGTYGSLFAGLDGRYVAAFVDAVLLAGPSAVSESRALLMLDPVHVDAAARDRAWERLLVDATLERTAERIMNIFTARRMHGPGRAAMLSRIAEVFAWGTREGLALTRRRHVVHMSEREHLGYTRFDHDRVWVSPLPILRGDRHGEQIVEALILHEIGHHRHHRGPGAAEVWKQADEQGLHGLLNLVADEHLERNLRALDASYGDRLKRLAAHAFRHAHRDLRVIELVTMLGHEAFDVLSQDCLGLAPGTERVRVESGKLLSLMERRGLSFARFMCALRMGLGNRHGDPRVAEALKLFPKAFRHYSMRELYEVAEKLRDLFGWQAALSNTYGGHETTGADTREQARRSRGITDDDVQREVERVLDPKRSRAGLGGDPNKLWINVSEDESFELIHNVVRVPPDRLRHREVVRDVARHARTLRGFLERLGLAQTPVRQRLKGKRIDRGRLTALVTRRDPHVLVSSEIIKSTDLFLGIVVDCSGSMEGSDNIQKARRFACLVSEAVLGLPGVDAHFFGFTDSVIYDAGDARRCAASSLEAGGGNNDAAALYHAATAAKRSRRRAKVLVMISDGLPTECSTLALKSLATRVTRSGMCVAQVAVCPLEEVCFPHYVVLEGELDASVRRFGQVVAKLVSRALG